MPRPIERGQKSVVVRGNGREWTFSAAAWPVLHALQENGTCLIDDLYERSIGELTTEQLRVFLKELVNEGLASIVVSGAPKRLSTALPSG